MNVYVNSQGKLYLAASPAAPGDQQIIDPSPALIASLSGSTSVIDPNLEGVPNLLAAILGSSTTGTASQIAALISLAMPVPVPVLQEGQKATYSATAQITLPASPTDIFTLQGSATRIVRVSRVGLSGLATSAGGNFAYLVKRSTSNAGGTTTAPTAVAHDSGDLAATAGVLQYSANPSSLGTSVGPVRAFYIPTPVVPAGPQQFTFGGDRNTRSIVLRGATQFFVLNLNGVSGSAGASVTVDVEWTEE